MSKIPALLKAFKAAKYAPSEGVPPIIRTAGFKAHMQKLMRKNLAHVSLTGERTEIKAKAYLKRAAARGVRLVSLDPLWWPMDFMDLKPNPQHWNFASSIKRYDNLMRGVPLATVCQAPYPLVLQRQGYTMLANGYVCITRDIALDYKGRTVSKLDLVDTPWGLAGHSQTESIEIIALPKRLRKVALTSTAQTDIPGVCRVPDELFDIKAAPLEWRDGAYRRKAPPAAFDVKSIGRYHSSASRLRPLDPLSAGIRIGLEIELECPEDKRSSATGVATAKFLNKLVHDRYTLVERDGSLSNGFELVVAPASVDFHRAAMAKLEGRGHVSERLNPFKRCLPAPSSAGVHIHVDRRSVRNWEALRMFFNAEQSRIATLVGWRKTLFGRRHNRYSGEWTWQYLVDNPGTSKYSSINADHKATYEARVFSSSNDAMVLLGHIEIMAAAVEWTNTMVGTPQRARLSVERFVEFISAHCAKYPEACRRATALQLAIENQKREDRMNQEHEAVALMVDLGVEHA